jgi:ABC-2 type transport system permease protein
MAKNILGFDWNRIRAVARRDLAAYLGNPTGYVFLTLFVAATGAAAFLQEDFFTRNLADLAQLNRAFPAILMLFVPAITMSSWADERRAGTDELLLTMPIRDVEVVLGKFLGALGIYSVALAFSGVNVMVLRYLGDPDLGLMLSTYMGYWLMGMLFIAVGLLASMFTQNVTVGFIVGVVCCGLLVAAGLTAWTSAVVSMVAVAAIASLAWMVVRGTSSRVGSIALVGAAASAFLWFSEVWPAYLNFWRSFGVGEHFLSFGEGILRLSDVVYFTGCTGVLLYVAVLLLGRRHW